MKKLQWGLNAHPENAPAFWGARAILKFGANNPICLLPDRQAGSGPLYKVLTQLLNEGGGLEIAQARTYALLNNWLMSSKKAQTFILLDTPLMKMVANTNGSHGYLYISAWLKPDALDLTGAQWSGSAEPPEAGKMIETAVWDHKVEVLTPLNIDGHHFLVFLTGRKPDKKKLAALRKWRREEQPRAGLPSAVDGFDNPPLAIGLTVGSELR